MSIHKYVLLKCEENSATWFASQITKLYNFRILVSTLIPEEGRGWVAWY
jgi:hypothetical protein